MTVSSKIEWCQKHNKILSNKVVSGYFINYCEDCNTELKTKIDLEFANESRITSNIFDNERPVASIAPVSPTGSLRYNEGKSQTNEIDPAFILGMGAVLEKSRAKYPRGNWAKGNNFSVPYDSLMRHLLAWHSGEKMDKESGLSHLHHAALNLMMLAYYEEHFPEMDDRIFKEKK